MKTIMEGDPSSKACSYRLPRKLVSTSHIKCARLRKLSCVSKVPSPQTAWTFLCGIHPSLTSDFPNRPTNPEHLALLDLPIKRWSSWNLSRQDAAWSATCSRDMTAMLCHVTGDEPPKSCKRCQTDYGMFDSCVVAPSGNSQAVMADQCSNCFIDQCEQCIWNDGRIQAAEIGSAERGILTSKECLPLSQPGRDDEPAEDNGPSELRPDDYPDENELSDLSVIEGSADEGFIAEDVELVGNGDTTNHQVQSRPLTERRISYENVFQMARDPKAKYKHCEYSIWMVLSIEVRDYTSPSTQSQKVKPR